MTDEDWRRQEERIERIHGFEQADRHRPVSAPDCGFQCSKCGAPWSNRLGSCPRCGSTPKVAVPERQVSSPRAWIATSTTSCAIGATWGKARGRVLEADVSRAAPDRSLDMVNHRCSMCPIAILPPAGPRHVAAGRHLRMAEGEPGMPHPVRAAAALAAAMA